MDKMNMQEIERELVNLIFLAETNLECHKMLWNYIMEEKGGNQTREILEGMGKIGEDIYNLPQGENENPLFFIQPQAQYLILIFIGHFFETVSIISSLLWPNKKEGISFNLWAERTLISNLKKISQLKEEFKKMKFLQMRHQIIAHKNFKKIKSVSELVGILNIVAFLKC